MTEQKFPILTVTVVVEHDGEFLLIKRPAHEENFPNVYAFPGGRAEIGETVMQTIRREVIEETGLSLMDEAAFIDSYYFGKLIGIAFLVCAKNKNLVLPDDTPDYAWVKSVEEMNKLDCIPLLWRHLARAQEILRSKKMDSLDRMDILHGFYSR